MSRREFKRWKREQRRLNRPPPGRSMPLRQYFKTLLRTTAFRIVLGFLAVFICFSLLQFNWLRSDAERILTEQIEQTILAEIEGLAEQYRRMGLKRMIDVVEARISRSSSSLYLIVNGQGEVVTGNISDVSPRTLKAEGLVETRYRLAKDDNRRRRLGLMQVFRTPEDYRLLIGHDLEDRARIKQAFHRSARLSITLTLFLGLVAAFMVARLVLRRVDAMTYKTYTIMNGDLTGRLPVTQRDDELDRLARSVNAMLERIEALMAGLKQVSDNVAHDLKTPLTRLRNRADEALRLAKGDEAHKAALEKVIEESDGLIRVFNALLLIARAEAGKLPHSLEPVDLAGVVADVAELYDAALEEQGGTLTVAPLAPSPIMGNRELISQAVANLIDNAMKYGRSADNGAHVTLSLVPEGGNIAVVVADNGPGIAEEDRKRVVDRFVRLEQSRSAPGFGIGLSLAHAVAKLHGGTLRLEENAPGLKVILSLPRV